MRAKLGHAVLFLALVVGGWLIPSQAQAASVKSVQSGEVLMDTTPKSVTITAVDTAKSFVVCTNRTHLSDESQRATCVLSSTAVTVTAGAAGTDNYVQWYVVEFEGGVSVQRSTASFATGDLTQNVPLTAVDLSKSFVLISERTTGGSNKQIDEEWTTRAQLTSTTNLELSRNESGIALTVAWQVVQMEGASVQRGLTTIAAASASATATISSVTTATSFLVMSRRGAAASNGLEGEYQVRGVLTNSTTLTFTRATGTANTVDIAWEVVSLSDGTTVQAGATLTAATTDVTANATIPSAIDTSRTVPFIWVNLNGSGGGFSRLDETSWTAAFSTTTNLYLQRVGPSGANAYIAWFVVQFFKCAAVADASYVAANAQNGQVIVYWSSPNPVLILRKPGAFSGEAPVNGTTYTAGSTIGGATVASVGSGVATSFTETIANGTLYYKVFATSGTCYSPGTVNTTSGVNASPAASPQTWSYAMAGGSILKGGIAGTGAVYSSSNASWIASLSTANGAQSWAPVATTAAIQGWLSWMPISGGAAAVAKVQQAKSPAGTWCQSGSTVTITPPAAITAGNLVIVAVSNGTFDIAATSVTDNNLVAYTPLTPSAYRSGAGKVHIWYKENAPAATSITVTWPQSVGYTAAAMVEYSGVATSGALDAQATATGSSNAPTVSLTTSQDNDLLYAVTVVNSGTVGAGSGYTPRNVDGQDCLNDEDKLTNTTGSNSATFSNTASVDWAIAMAAFKAASGAAVIGGDQSGKVYSVDATTGVTNWTANLQPSGADAVQAAVSAQLRQYSNAAFQSTYTTDVIFAATRNASNTNNKLFALKASDGSVLWSFNGTVSTGNNVDYIVGQPWVDYARNYVYIASRAGSGGAQSSVWVINSLNGNLVASRALGTNVHLQTSLTLSQDGKTLYVSDTSGNLYALDTTTLPASLGNKWSSPAALGAAIADTSFIWENNTTVSSGGAITFVQAQNVHFNDAGSTTITVPITTTAGNLLVAYIREGINNTATWTVSDSAGQSWTQTTSGYVQANTSNRASMFYKANSAAVTSVTATFSASMGIRTMVVFEISGAATSSVEDASVNLGTNVSQTSLTSGSLTTANANDILIYAVGVSGDQTSFTAGAGYTLPANASNARMGMQYKVVSATQSGVTTSMSWSPSAQASMGTFAAFKKAAGGVPVPADLLYFSTVDGYLWCLQDLGAGAPPSVTTPCTGWSAVKTAVPGPSTPLLLNKLFVGSWNGTLGQIYQLDPTTGAIEKQVTVGDGTKQPGDVSTETSNEIFVGTSEGTIFKFPLTGGSL